MSPEQRRLARHALGLPNEHRRSYRNRFAANRQSDDWQAWSAMCDAHLATFGEGIALDWFYLTRSAAEMVLEPGETLYLEDFPHD